MSKQILRALPELVQAGIVDEATAEKIKAYYAIQSNTSANRLFVVFGILGGLLVGLGIVLILAHNWDDLSRPVRVAIGIAPLLLAQIVAGRLILKGINDRAWREGVSAFLFCAIGVSLAVVSQAYNMGGDLADFLLTWMCLAVPIIYALGSGIAALLCIGGITWYACELSYFTYLGSNPAPMYWVVIAAIIPYYYYGFLRPRLKNNFFVLISWILVLSLTICLATVSENTGRLFLIAYVSLFSTFVMAGETNLFQTHRILSNGYLVVGSLGVVTILLIASFTDFWDWDSTLDVAEYSLPGISVITLTTLLALSVLVVQIRGKGASAVNIKGYAFVFFMAVYFLGAQSPMVGALMMNLGILVMGVYTIRAGARQNHLGLLNYGLSIITALILCRFFDTDLSFVVRGLLFISVGIGFFAANYYLIKQRMANK